MDERPGPLEGCDEPPPALLRKGIEQFNRGDYWECHETLETLWRAEPRAVRQLYQGVLQIGVGFYHLRAGNCTGALRMLGRGGAKLNALPDRCQGVPVADLARAARAIQDRLAAFGGEDLSESDLRELPRLELLVD